MTPFSIHPVADVIDVEHVEAITVRFAFVVFVPVAVPMVPVPALIAAPVLAIPVSAVQSVLGQVLVLPFFALLRCAFPLLSLSLALALPLGLERVAHIVSLLFPTQRFQSIPGPISSTAFMVMSFMVMSFMLMSFMVMSFMVM